MYVNNSSNTKEYTYVLDIPMPRALNLERIPFPDDTGNRFTTTDAFLGTKESSPSYTNYTVYIT